MKIEVVVLSYPQVAQTQKTLSVLNTRTKRIMRDLKDNRIDVSDLQEYVNSLTSAINKLEGLLYEDLVPSAELALKSNLYSDIDPITNP